MPSTAPVTPAPATPPTGFTVAPPHSVWNLSASPGEIDRFPIVNLIVLEIGLALGLMALAINNTWYPASGALAVIAALIAFSRFRGRWTTRWFVLLLGYLLRKRTHSVLGHGPERKLALLRLFIPDLLISATVDHEDNEIGLAWHSNGWIAVLRVESPQQLIAPATGIGHIPLGVLKNGMRDRGVVLDAVQVVWHGYLASALLPRTSPILAAYLEVVGSVPASARRNTLLAIRLDPRLCPEAIAERGGGATGAHRALVASVARLRSALAEQGIITTPLNKAEVLEAGINSAELINAVGDGETECHESWGRFSAAGIGHGSYAVTSWPTPGKAASLGALINVGGLSSTVALTITTNADSAEVGVRGFVRVSARHPNELAETEGKLLQASSEIGVKLMPLHGLQRAGLAATLPFGGPQ